MSIKTINEKRGEGISVMADILEKGLCICIAHGTERINGRLVHEATHPLHFNNPNYIFKFNKVYERIPNCELIPNYRDTFYQVYYHKRNAIRSIDSIIVGGVIAHNFSYVVYSIEDFKDKFMEIALKKKEGKK